jgi:hypothetical protein
MLAETQVFFFLALPYDHNHDSPQSIPKFDWSFISFITKLNLCFNLHVFDECRSTYYLYLMYLFNNCNWCDSAFQTCWFMVFNATFNNISAISWRSVLLVEESTQSTWRKPTTCRNCKSLTNFITECCIEYTSPEKGSDSQR